MFGEVVWGRALNKEERGNTRETRKRKSKRLFISDILRNEIGH